MALRTITSTALQAFLITSPGATGPIPWLPNLAGNEVIPADVAALNVAIKNDLINGGSIANLPIWGGAYSQSNLLSIPNRGVLKVYPGDFIAWDTQTGWPILVSGLAAANAGYSHT
jgi:hypothetical protein